ncbi:hypothetical protein GLAREA_02608 [Glarea lozoyensis ATCC 20868]|uniref:Uncharacterized protein n=1 Tax=Glarea lozoyensis (strain ATCC 20868 / MF5171) TaxID=1116229 RepID=S3CLV8_GLAL2|nr:uncharacterized protein GLAREA_02608 [Glarea lozoyensis ATCC 20868]EPE26695.1 hypothetical protein GLAREA_02608 [Glarea lozoyensis ATCC 20868]
MSSRPSKRPHGSGSGRSRRTTQQSVSQLIDSLNTHRVNTLTELRRIERVAADSSEEDQLAFQGPMTSAWTYYVTSNNLLSELRGLTRNYPFSSEMLDDAKWRVSNDPDSNRSWNYAWLVLIKIQDDALVDIYAEAESVKPEMWDGRVPEPEEAQQLAACFVWEWKEALDQMLRHWETPPTTTGY